MSQENVEIVRRMLDAFDRGDWTAVLERFDPHVELDMKGHPEGGVYRGRDELVGFYRRWLGAWEAFEVIPGRIIDAGDRVLVLQTVRGRGKGSGVVVEMQAADIYLVGDGKIVAQRGFHSHGEALEAVGLQG